MNKPLPYGVVIMGVSGSGKSTVGRVLAAELDCAFIEGDDYHSESNVAKMQNGHALRDEDRWPWLDRIGYAMRNAIVERGIAVASCSALKKSVSGSTGGSRCCARCICFVGRQLRRTR